MTALDKPPRYQIYLLRCWQERSQQTEGLVVTWRFSLENPHTGQRHGFANLETLISSLTTEFAADEQAENPDVGDL